MVVWERALSQRHIFLVPAGSQFSSAGCDSWVQTSTRCSGLASTSVFVENRPKSAGKTPTTAVNTSEHSYYKHYWSCETAFTQFESTCQASDDSDWIGGVCAELMKWGKESIPLVLKLDPKIKTFLDTHYFVTVINKTKSEHFSHKCWVWVG